MLSLLICLLGIAVFTDLSARRIPNVLVMFGVAAALVTQLLPVTAHPFGSVSATGVLASVFGGAGIGFVIMFPPYLLRGMGAGDVKLMMMVGAFLGPSQTAGAALLSLLAGGVLAIAMALWHGSCWQVTSNLRYMLTVAAHRLAGGAAPAFEPLQQTAGRMPYAVAIAAGTILQLILVRSGGWALS